MERLSGQLLGNYQIGTLIGRGNRASVYQATSRLTGMAVGLRVIDRALSADSAFSAKFQQAMAAVASLSHPNLLPLLDYGFAQGFAFLARPLIEGGTLRSQFGHPMDQAATTRLLQPIAEVLDYVHGRGVYHGDIKPGNILITASGQPLLADLGTAPIIAQANTIVATARGNQFGTPEYLAPEQVQGRTWDYRADLYTFGILLYEALVGRPPFRAEQPGDTPRQIALAHLSTLPPSPRLYNPTLNAETERILRHALEKQPAQRFQNATTLINALGAASLGQAPAALVVPAAAFSHTNATPTAPPAAITPASNSKRGWSRTRI